jgi:hypothetical protein
MLFHSTVEIAAAARDRWIVENSVPQKVAGRESPGSGRW